jgi:hypothetical protein
VIVQTLDLTILMVAITRRLKMSPRDIRRLAPVLRTIAAASLAGLAAFGVKLAVAGWPAFFALVACSMVFGAVCLAGTFILGAVTSSEKAEMRVALLKIYRSSSQRLGISTAS